MFEHYVFFCQNLGALRGVFPFPDPFLGAECVSALPPDADSSFSAWALRVFFTKLICEDKIELKYCKKFTKRIHT